jgi:intein/homing endonuclease
LLVKLGNDTIIATPIHHFWKAGQGWVMARDLKPGDPLRTFGGVARVTSVEPDEVRPVFNLEVVGDQNFFAGQSAALVHDHTLVEASSEPFDAAASLR